MTELFEAGTYFIEEFKITRLNDMDARNPDEFIEISGQVAHFEINESMDRGHLWGHAQIIDSTGMLDGFINGPGIRGEEQLFIRTKDWFGVEQWYDMFLYAIEKVKAVNPQQETGVEFYVYFTSRQKFLADRRTVRKAYVDGLISEYVDSCFNEFIRFPWRSSKGMEEIEDTTGIMNLSIPSLTPENTMHFFARRAYTAENSTQTFRFFENRKGFYFATHEKMIELYEQRDDKPRKFEIIQFPDFSPQGQEILMQSIITIEFPEYVNTYDDLLENSYYRRVTEMDLLNRTLLTTEYRHADEYQKFVYPDGIKKDSTKHTKDFVDEYLDDHYHVFVPKDYKNVDIPGRSLPNPKYYADIYNKKQANLLHHTRNIVEMTIHGRNNIRAGDVLEIEIPKFNLRPDQRMGDGVDELKSGKYLVESIRNVHTDNTGSQGKYRQVIKMSKSGLKEKPQAGISYNNEPQIISTFSESQ